VKSRPFALGLFTGMVTTVARHCYLQSPIRA
jgi:hypothetical protein